MVGIVLIQETQMHAKYERHMLNI